MNAFLISTDETEMVSAQGGSLNVIKLSRTEIRINHWIDIAEAILDRYIVTPLLGPNQSEIR
jgi:hypothetical protein